MQRAVFLLLAFTTACGASSDPTPAPHPATASGVVTVRSEPADRGHVLVVDNGTGTPLRLQRTIEVEREAGGAWEHVEASMLYLRERCDSAGGGLVEPPACVEIPAGTTFRAAAWTDMVGDAQCACEECGDASAGRYRMAVTPCDGGARLETAPFAIE